MKITMDKKWAFDESPEIEVKILTTESGNKFAPLVVLDMFGVAHNYRKCGHRYPLDTTGKKLVPLREEVTLWANVYRLGVQRSDTFSVVVHNNKKEAERCASSKTIACIPITFTEGEGL